MQPDEGTIEIGGEATRLGGPHEAIRRGVGMVQQRFQLLESLTALENLVLGREPARGPVFDRRAALREAEELAGSSLRVRIPWRAPARALSVGERQRLEILRLLYRNAELLILDEPTTVLTPEEVEDLFVVLRRLRDGGRTIVFISHKLREVQTIADRVTVMRDGRVVATVDEGAIEIDRLAELMVGDSRLASLAIDAAPEEAGAGNEEGPDTRAGPSLLVEDVHVRSPTRGWALAGVELEVRRGEIVGIAGVEGNGQRELVEAVVGLRRPDRGRVLLADQDVTRAGVAERRAGGLAFISEDRDAEGVYLEGPIRDSAISLRYRRAPLSQLFVLRMRRIGEFVRSLLARFGVRAARDDAPVRSLSGGNVQRLVVGRELEGRPNVLVAAHPTRGVDIRGIAFVHEQLREVRAGGGSVLLVSEELDELLALSDRLIVLYEGKVRGRLARPEFHDRARIGRLIAGAQAA